MQENKIYVIFPTPCPFTSFSTHCESYTRAPQIACQSFALGCSPINYLSRMNGVKPYLNELSESLSEVCFQVLCTKCKLNQLIACQMTVTHLYILDSYANTNQTRVGICIGLEPLFDERFNASETSCRLENNRYMMLQATEELRTTK